jgi:AcrR family transcriptional regulator
MTKIAAKQTSRKVAQKKQKKETDLIQAAFRLFLIKGAENTSIDDIVKKAGVAKGTFYLYFKDKNELIDQIIINSAGDIILKVYTEQIAKNYAHFEDLVIAVLDDIIERLRKNTALLCLIHRNVTWTLYRKAMKKESGESLLDLLKKDEQRYNRNKDVPDEAFEKRMFILLEMTISLAYTTVIRNEPCGIDELKPTLFGLIRKMLQEDTVVSVN